MPARTEYKLISADSAANFQAQLTSAAMDKWKPILLTSTANNVGLMIAAILEREPGK
jgi:hypothetical protein